MGIRMDQFAGLAPTAEAFLAKNQRPPRTCPTCGHVVETYMKKLDTFYYGMFDQKYLLHSYPLKGGGYANQFLQAAPWSSGPVHFLGLRMSDGTELVWTEEEMQEWL